MYGFMKLDSTVNKNKTLIDYFKKHKIFFRQQEVFIRSNDQISTYQENTKNTDIREIIKHFEIYKIVQLDKESFTPLWTFIDKQENRFKNYSSQKRPILLQSSPFKLEEIDQVITPTIKELFPDEQLILANDIYKKELDKVLQRAEELEYLIRGNEELRKSSSSTNHKRKRRDDSSTNENEGRNCKAGQCDGSFLRSFQNACMHDNNRRRSMNS